MKVFISWSGNDSKQVAQLLKEWIPDVLQGVETWISSDDIDKGAVWMNDINDQLKEIGVGILCLTRNNIDAPWILFEAGALSKGLTKNRVCPLLINLSHTELKPPLASFNATIPTREEMLKLIKTINAQVGEKRLPEDRVEKAFEMWWGPFEKKFAAIVKAFRPAEAVTQRPIEDMVAEILELARSIQVNVQKPPAFQTLPLPPSGWSGLTQPLGSAHPGWPGQLSPDIAAWLTSNAPTPLTTALLGGNTTGKKLVFPPTQTDTSSSD